MGTPATHDTPFWTDRSKAGEHRLRLAAGWTSIVVFLVWIGCRPVGERSTRDGSGS